MKIIWSDKKYICIKHLTDSTPISDFKKTLNNVGIGGILQNNKGHV